MTLASFSLLACSSSAECFSASRFISAVWASCLRVSSRPWRSCRRFSSASCSRCALLVGLVLGTALQDADDVLAVLVLNPLTVLGLIVRQLLLVERVLVRYVELR